MNEHDAPAAFATASAALLRRFGGNTPSPKRLAALLALAGEGGRVSAEGRSNCVAKEPRYRLNPELLAVVEAHNAARGTKRKPSTAATAVSVAGPNVRLVAYLRDMAKRPFFVGCSFATTPESPGIAQAVAAALEKSLVRVECAGTLVAALEAGSVDDLLPEVVAWVEEWARLAPWRNTPLPVGVTVTAPGGVLAVDG
jgi:hypothetical protein